MCMSHIRFIYAIVYCCTTYKSIDENICTWRQSVAIDTLTEITCHSHTFNKGRLVLRPLVQECQNPPLKCPVEAGGVTLVPCWRPPWYPLGGQHTSPWGTACIWPCWPGQGVSSWLVGPGALQAGICSSGAASGHLSQQCPSVCGG